MASRFCTRCGQPIPTNATTCPRCGTPVTASPAATTASAVPTPTPTATPTGTPGAEGAASARRVCGNCRAPMRWIGHYSLRASGPPGPIPGMAGSEVAETLLPFSLYYCQTCGKFDFYYPGT